MSSRLKKIISMLLVFVLVFQMFPLTAFAEGVMEAEGPALAMTERPDTMDSLYYQGVTPEYTADDVLYELDYMRTETEKHFHMANGSDIAVSYTFPVHYEDENGELQEIDNSLKLYNADGTLSTEPVKSGLMKDAEIEDELLETMTGETAEPEQTPAPTPADEAAEATPAPIPEETAAPIPVETAEPQPENGAETEAVTLEALEQLTADEGAEALSDEAEAAEAIPDSAENADAEVIPAELNEQAAEETPEPASDDKAAEATPVPIPEETAAPIEAVETAAPEIEATEAEAEKIDARELLAALPIDTRVYKNAAGLADVSLAVSGGAGRLASISYGGYTVTLTPQIKIAQNANARASATAEAMRIAEIAGEVRAIDKAYEKDSFEAKIMPDKLSSALVYEGIMDGSDLEYIIGETSLKENIIVNSAADEYIYSFILDAGGLTPELTENGSIELKDGSGKAVFVIPAGYMYDADGESSMEVKYSLEQADGKYILTVEADAGWINEPERAFPVTIDPPVYLQGFYNIETGTIFQYYPDNIGGQRATEALGYYSANNGYCRTLVRVNNLPKIPDNSYVVYSGLYLYELTYSHVAMSSLRVQAQALSWNYPTNGYWCLYHSWNDTPDPLPEVIDFTDVTNGRAFFGWNITREAINWYNDPDTNYGISLQATKEGSMTASSCANVGFASSNTSNDAARPYFIVEYRNCAGLEGYFSYQSHGIDRAGAGYIGDYSGQLTLVKEDVSAASTANPVSISHVYNSTYSSGEYRDSINAANGKYNSFDIGKGWMLSFMQAISPAANGYLVYVDGDGTLHYFYPDGSVYKDEDGLGLTITASGTNYTMKDKKGNISYFSGGVLTYTQDTNGNKISYNMDQDNVPISVTRQNSGGSVETIATFTYNGAGYLYSITDSVGNVTTLGYTNGCLTSVNHPDGTTVSYSYGQNGKLISATDNESGYGMHYEYDANTGKVKRFYEQSGMNIGAQIRADGSFKGIQTYRYCGEDRIFDTDDDIVSHHVLDYFGRTTSSYSTDSDGNKIYGSSFTAYSLNSGVSSTNNRALISTATGTQTVNLLGYPSIEGTSTMSATPWSFSGGGSASILFGTPRSGTRSVCVSRTAANTESVFSQTLTGLDPNSWYVLSGYVNTAGVTSFGTGKIAMTASGAKSVEGTSVNWDTSGVGDGWERIYVTAQPNSNGSLTLSVKISGVAGKVYLDDFQAEISLFEDRGTPGSVSLLTNGSMKNSTGWSTWTPNRVSYVNDSEFGRVLKINGDSYEGIDVYQDVYLVQPGTQTYLLSGWAKASAVPLQGSGNRSFSLWVELYYADEDGTSEKHSVECNVDSEEWQYVSLPIVPKQPDLPVASVRVYLTFCRNPNTALFANVSLTREDAQSYKYNSDGELISVTSSENEKESFSYSGADLISQVTQGNGTIKYEYDSKHNVTKATNDGLSMSATYDGKGNTTGTTLTGTGSTSKISTTAAYDTNGNLLTSETDARGKSVRYAYDNAVSKKTGQPTSVTDAKGTEVYTFYNAKNGRVESVGVGYSPSISYSYTNGRITTMTRSAYFPGSSFDNVQNYTIGYDGFGNMTSVNVGNRNLVSYSYGAGNGMMMEQVFGTGDSLSYEYDELERVSDVYYNEDVYNPAVSYSYSSNGGLSRVDDYAAGRRHLYNYDALGRMTSMTEHADGKAAQFYRAAYDGANRVKSMDYRVSPAWNGTMGAVRNYGYTYDSGNGSLTAMTLPADGAYSYSYDALMRLTGRTLKLDGKSFLTRNYGFVSGSGANSTTLMVSSLSNKNGSGASLNSYSYSYDDVGNITKITGSTNATYTYDEQGQLLSEAEDGITTTYSYDGAGNIVSVDDGYETHSYTYGDSSWGDLLTAYDGYTISYDAIGNPTTWYDMSTFTWEQGRRLASAENIYTGLSNSYTYDADGLRLSKTVGNVEHKYVWQGNKLVSEYFGGKELEFFYDESGKPYAFSYKTSANAIPSYYYYVTNLQGDVVSILDANGNEKASYSYNAWGKILSATGDMALVNPLRYRGYYYDDDTGFYYLKSRYYDPQIQRFINADGLTSTGQGILGTNMFAYCLNNPVALKDSEGGLANMVIGGIVGGLIGGLTSAMQGDSFLAGAAQGAVSGAIAGFGVDAALILVTAATVASPVIAATATVVAAGTAAAAGYGGSLAGEHAYSLVKEGKFAEIDESSRKVAAANAVINTFSFGISTGVKAVTTGLKPVATKFVDAVKEVTKTVARETFMVSALDAFSTFVTTHLSLHSFGASLVIKNRVGAR